MNRKPFNKRAAWSILFFDLTLMPALRGLARPFVLRKPLAACFATFLIHPIAGMFYLGRWKRALLYAFASPAFIALETYLLLHVKGFPNPPYVFLLDALVLRLIGAVDAYYIAKSWQPRPLWYTRWYAALGLWLGIVAITFAGFTVLRVTVSEIYSALADIDRPVIMKDDLFLLFKMPGSYGQGDLVAIEQEMYGQRHRLFWRIIALPGDRVAIKGSTLIINGKTSQVTEIGEHTYQETLPGGNTYPTYSTQPITMEEQRVPEGMFFMLSDNRDIYRNTDFFAQPQFIAKENIMGKVVFICKAPCPLKTKL